VERTVPSLDLTPRLTTRPGLRLLSYLALLPASAVELDAAVERAVAENPLLERLRWHRCPACGLATAGDRCPACLTARWATEPGAEEDWREELLREAALELPMSLRPVLASVVAALDEHGLMPLPPKADAADLAAVVMALRLVGPPGIAAVSPLDCVRVQAHGLVASGAAPALVSQVAEEWLAEVAGERYADIALATGETETAVIAAARLLRERIRPFVALAGRAARSAPADVVFTLPDPDAGPVAHVAEPAAAGVGQVRDMLPDDAEARAWAAPYRDAAERLLAAIGARSRMLQRVADELARRQPAFIVEGPHMHRPLRRSELATALAVHPSTVGRVVGGKVARCPDGRMVPLADFFGTAASTWQRVTAALVAHPGAADREIANVLSRTGDPIARRTVAKYRALGTNPPSPAH
jgi:RNA polymerase sigma-54 factor